MKAIVWHGIGDIRLDNVAEPKIKKPSDAIVRLTASAICGTDLHMVRGTMSGMKPGTILGHEGVGVVEEVGKEVRNFQRGDRVVMGSTIGCGYCSYCRDGYYAQCDHANPNGPQAGTAFYGGPKTSGPFDGMQAEFVRVPFADVGPLKVPDDVSDEQVLFLGDIFPTGYMAAENCDIVPGDTIAVWGAGPVGLFAAKSAFLLGAERVIVIDSLAFPIAALAWCPKTAPNYRAYRKARFLPVPPKLRPIEINFGARALVPEAAAFAAPDARWYVSFLDSDTN